MTTVTILGNLTRDPEQVTIGGSEAVKFGIASNSTRDSTTFYDVTVWGKSGNAVLKFCKKGSRVLVVGELTIKETYHNVNAYQVTFTGAQKRSEDGDYDPFAEE